MEGITVIETISHTVEKPIFSWVVIIALIAMSMGAAHEALDRFQSQRVLEGCVATMIIVVSLFFVFQSCGLFVNNQQEETLYVVQVDDNVSVKEFHKNYEIVSIDGDRYTVRLLND